MPVRRHTRVRNRRSSAPTSAEDRYCADRSRYRSRVDSDVRRRKRGYGKSIFIIEKRRRPHAKRHRPRLQQSFKARSLYTASGDPTRRKPKVRSPALDRHGEVAAVDVALILYKSASCDAASRRGRTRSCFALGANQPAGCKLLRDRPGWAPDVLGARYLYEPATHQREEGTPVGSCCRG